MSTTALDLRLPFSGVTSVRRQLGGRIAEAMAHHRLHPGDPLPPSSELAERLVVSPRAVHLAYEQLVRSGVAIRSHDGTLRVAAGLPLPPASTANDDLGRAHLLQRRLLPAEEVDGDGFHLSARYRPAGPLGGDFYSVCPSSQGLTVAVGDVAGHGVTAALRAAWLVALLPQLAAEGDVAGVLAALAQRLRGTTRERELVALTCLRLEPASGRLEVASAGFPEPILLRAGREPEELPIPAPRLPLGTRQRVAYRSRTLRLGTGDRLLLYSDGLPELRARRGELLGYERLMEVVEKTLVTDAGSTLREAVDRLVESALIASGTDRPDDDLTVLLLERTGSGGSA